MSTTYGLCEAPPVVVPPRPAPPPPAREGVEKIPDRAIDEFAVALPEQLLPRSGFDRIRMCRAVVPLLEGGWEPAELARAVERVAPLPYAVISGVGLLEARLRTVAREQPRARAAPAVPWCGQCEREDHRWLETEAGGWVKCPRCHPAGGGQPSSGGADPPF